MPRGVSGGDRGEIYRRAIDKWGVENQLDKAIEEMAELTTAIVQFRHKRIPVEDVLDEIADVRIMTEQLIGLMGRFSELDVEEFVCMVEEEKILRLGSYLTQGISEGGRSDPPARHRQRRNPAQREERRFLKEHWL